MASEDVSVDVDTTSLRIKCTIPAKLRKVPTDEKSFDSRCTNRAELHNQSVLETVNSIHGIFLQCFKGWLELKQLRNCTEAVSIKEAYEFIAEVAPFTLEGKPIPAIVLFLIIKDFFNHVKQRKFRRDMMPVLFISSPHFFTDECIPEHEQLLQSVYFGNIINSGTMAVHWTVEFGFRDRKKGPGLNTQRLMAHFEYDRACISIRFKNVERDNRSEVREAVMTAEYTIKFYFSAIRRIIVDQDDSRRRIHFELSCPPYLHSFIPRGDRPHERFGDGNRIKYLNRGDEPEPRDDGPEYASESAISESTVVTIEFPPERTAVEDEYRYFEIISRLRIRVGMPIECACMDLIRMHIGLNSPYVKSPLSCPAFLERIEYASPQPAKKKDKPWAGQFKLRYLIEALLSRGAKVKDQLLVNPENWTTFLKIICKQYKKNQAKTLIVIENLMNRIDEMVFPIQSIFTLLLEEFRAYEENKRVADAQLGVEAREKNMENDGYVKVRKVVITPTRIIYIAPEQIMGNRVLRKFNADGTQIIRVQFRDDDAQQMRTPTTGEKLIKKTVEKALKDGIIVGGRNFRYLGSSNSQMRDHGAYFCYDREPSYITDASGNEIWQRSEKIEKIRRNIGRLEELSNVAKFMARMGQCFTQSRRVNTGLPLNTSNFIYDVVGGNTNSNDDSLPVDPYTYSDGVGQISIEYMRKISEDLKLPNYPSCIQFRHRGYKGVMSLHPPLDELNKLRRRLGMIPMDAPIVGVESTQDPNGMHLLNCRFRASQCKFHAAKEEEFEVVKIGGPTPVCLNKPFINILDQVAEMQSRDIHIRMSDRIEELLHRQLRIMAETLVREKSCRDRLKELPCRFSIDCLDRKFGFALTTEPFFRSLLKAAVRFMIKKLLNKEQIQIPLHLGRSMFGVVDETGLLQYGQVFVQYHVNVVEKTPKPTAAKEILRGPVLITKNPCIVAGDVRMFEAVDIPALRHLVDVVVFPQHGPRPHPDEMAGSDLDGDEYSVIWDPQLFIDHNEKPMKFPKAVVTSTKLDMNTLDEDMRNFFIMYLTQDAVGMIANAHLINSDLWGLNSQVAKTVAYKHSQAVDFPKTSQPPAPLTKSWTIEKIGDETIHIPPERPQRKPDFMQNNRDPVYASERLIGRIFREIGNVDEVLALSEERDSQDEVTIDDFLVEDGWEAYADHALAEMLLYNNEIKAIMERYGVVSEGELMSGCMTTIRNALSDKEADDMSFFNTNLIIETNVSMIMHTYRERFFKEFGDFKELTIVPSEMKNVSEDTDNIFHRQVSNPTPRMRQKAVAMYRVCYDYVSNQRDSSPRLLSYAWIAYDVLAVVREAKVLKTADYVPGLDPVDTMLGDHVREYAAARQEEYKTTIDSWTGRDGKGDGVEAIMRYIQYYKGLGELAFFFVQWAEHEKICMRHFKETHIVLMLIQFCLGYYDELDSEISVIHPNTKPLDPPVELTNPGRVVLHFLRFLSSRTFKRLKMVSFGEPDLGVDGCFMRGEWMPLHQASIKSFYDLIFSLRIDMPIHKDLMRVDPPPILREMLPFVIELPFENCNDTEVAEMIRRQTGAVRVRLRRLMTNEKTRVIISATGTLLSHSFIRKLLIVPNSIKTNENPKEMSDNFPLLILDHIKKGAEAY